MSSTGNPLSMLAKRIVKFFTRNETRSVPLIVNSASSDHDFDENDFKSPAVNGPSPRFDAGNSSSSMSTSLLGTSDRTATKRETLGRQAVSAAKSGLSTAVSTAVSHFAPGSGVVIDAAKAAQTGRSVSKLIGLLDLPCDAQKPDLCQGLVACVLTRKEERLKNTLLEMIPGVGTLVSVINKGHNVDKRIVGEQGEGREELARLIIDHAKECNVAVAIYAEVVCGDLSSKKAFKQAADDIHDDEQWGASDKAPEYRARTKLKEQLKPV